MIRSRQPKVEKTAAPAKELRIDMNVELTWDAPPSLSISIGQLLWDDTLQCFRIWTGFEWLQVSGFSL